MKHLLLWCIIGFVALMTTGESQAQWRCLYATWDETTNGTGHNTTSVGVIRENMFISLIMTRNTRNFMIPYVNADSSNGRRYSYGYGSASTSGIYQEWTDGAFDQVLMNNAFKLVTTPDSLIYVANNDPNHNILVFKYVNDTIKVVAPFLRQETGPNSIFGLEVDQNGYVYVCNDTTTGRTDDVKVYRPVSQWTAGHTDPPITTINLPDGIYKGITVSANGQQLFVSDYGNRRILKYVGSPQTGYTQATGFTFQLSPTDTIVGTPNRPSVLGLAHLRSNNILFAAVDAWLGGGSAYSYGRIVLINPNSGALASPDSSISVIDVAKWNFDLTGGHNLRTDGKVPGNASGYTSTYDVDFDIEGNLYSQSHYGWTVEKWQYTGLLPVITGVIEVPGSVPETYILKQNYPNPFNPATIIEFSIQQTDFVSLKVYDVLGREVASLVNEEKPAGTYRATFDARELTSGAYYYTLRTGSFSETKKMLLMK